MAKKKLTKYCYSVSGDMLGSFYGEEIKLIDENRAVLKISSKDRHNSELKETEIDIDAAVLDDIANVYRKYHMKRWERRKISRMFIADGASRSYDFYFDNGKSTRFSSQHYPTFYRNRINKLSAIIDQYKKPV